MTKDTKLYKVELGALDKKAGDVMNWRTVNVIARDAAEAIKKVKMRGSEYPAAVDFVALVEVQ